MTDLEIQAVVTVWTASGRPPQHVPATTRTRMAGRGVLVETLRPTPTIAQLRAQIGRDPEDASCVRFALEHMWEVRVRDAGAARVLDGLAVRVPARDQAEFAAFRRIIEGRLADHAAGLEDADIDRWFEAHLRGERLGHAGPVGDRRG